MVRPVTEDDTGLKRLWSCSTNQTSQGVSVDIVAVHGIGAHPDDSWCKNIGLNDQGQPQYVNWLQDERMLPEATPTARIMRYGYESQWFGDDQINTVGLKATNIAQQLLEELYFERENCQTRPLIFIAHCFGGLVVLKALQTAFEQRKRWPGVFDATTGLVFFSTPFRGAEGMNQSELIAAALSRYRPDQVHGESLRILSPGDEFLQGLVDRFLDIRSSQKNAAAEVACFYETKSSNVGAIVGEHSRRTFVVSEASGCLDLSETTHKHALARTHFDINKFGKPTEPSYKVVRKVIRDMVAAIPDLISARSEQNLSTGARSDQGGTNARRGQTESTNRANTIFYNYGNVENQAGTQNIKGNMIFNRPR